MNSPTLIEEAPAPAAAPWEGELLALELRVARRADELAGSAHAAGWPDVWAWIQAEREILFAGALAPAVT